MSTKQYKPGGGGISDALQNVLSLKMPGLCPGTLWREKNTFTDSKVWARPGARGI